jgi:hypothetical protein
LWEGRVPGAADFFFDAVAGFGFPDPDLDFFTGFPAGFRFGFGFVLGLGRGRTVPFFAAFLRVPEDFFFFVFLLAIRIPHQLPF